MTYQEKELKRGETFNLLVLGTSKGLVEMRQMMLFLYQPLFARQMLLAGLLLSGEFLFVCCCLKVFQNCFSLNGGKQISSRKDRGLEETYEVAEVVRHIRKGNLKVLSEV